MTITDMVLVLKIFFQVILITSQSIFFSFSWLDSYQAQDRLFDGTQVRPNPGPGRDEDQGRM